MGLVKPYVAITGTRTSTFKMKSLEEYHYLKSKYPKETFLTQCSRVPHVCYSNYWKDSPHCGHQYWDCVEVTKIIDYEDEAEKKHSNREYSLRNCFCHWCRHRRRLNHIGYKLCEGVEEESIFLQVSDDEDEDDEDEKKINLP